MSRPIVLTEANTRATLVKLGRYLEFFTIGYNSLEGLIDLAGTAGPDQDRV